jgi:hypothetical protein
MYLGTFVRPIAVVAIGNADRPIRERLLRRYFVSPLWSFALYTHDKYADLDAALHVRRTEHICCGALSVGPVPGARRTDALRGRPRR